MSLPVQCPQCGTQFNARLELAGKRVKCSQCGSVISIPAAPQQRAAPSQARPAAPQSAAPPTMPGIGDMLEDAKVGELVAPTILRPGETMCPSCNAAVPMGAAVCVKCGFDFRSGKIRKLDQPKPLDPRILKTLGAVGALVAIVVGTILSVVAMFVFPVVWNVFKLGEVDAQWRNYGISMMIVFGMLTLLFNATILADAFKEGPLKGIMYLFVPFYALYFICTRWAICWKPFLLSLLTSALLYWGVFMYIEGQKILDAKPPEPGVRAR
jgi:predicted Zn finger-like uncharacterized protein